MLQNHGPVEHPSHDHDLNRSARVNTLQLRSPVHGGGGGTPSAGKGAKLEATRVQIRSPASIRGLEAPRPAGDVASQLSGFLSSIPEIVARGDLASQCPGSLSYIPESDARSAARGEGKRGRYTNVKPYQGSPPRIGKKGRGGDGVPGGGHWIGGPQVLLPAIALALTVVARRAPPLQ